MRARQPAGWKAEPSTPAARPCRIPVLLCLLGRFLNNALGVVARCIDGVHLHRLFTSVDDVVPYARRNLYGPAVGDLLLDGHVVLVGAHDALANSRIQAQELVSIVVHLQADRIAGSDRHEGYLQVLTRPCGGSVVGVFSGGSFNVKDVGFRSVCPTLATSLRGWPKL